MADKTKKDVGAFGETYHVTDPDQPLNLENPADCMELRKGMEQSHRYLQELTGEIKRGAAPASNRQQTGPRSRNEDPSPLFGIGTLTATHPVRNSPTSLPAVPTAAHPVAPSIPVEPLSAPQAHQEVSQDHPMEGMAESVGTVHQNVHMQLMGNAVPEGFPGAGTQIQTDMVIDFTFVREWLQTIPLNEKRQLELVSGQEVQFRQHKVQISPAEGVMLHLCGQFFKKLPPASPNPLAEEVLFGLFSSKMGYDVELSPNAKMAIKGLQDKGLIEFISVVASIVFPPTTPRYEAFARLPIEVIPKELMSYLQLSCSDAYLVMTMVCHFINMGEQVVSDMPEYLYWFDDIYNYLNTICRGPRLALELPWLIRPKEYPLGSFQYQPSQYNRGTAPQSVEKDMDQEAADKMLRLEQRNKRIAGYLGSSGPTAGQQTTPSAVAQFKPPAASSAFGQEVIVRDTTRFTEYTAEMSALKRQVEHQAKQIEELRVVVLSTTSDLASANREISQIKSLLTTITTQANRQDLSARQTLNQSFLAPAPAQTYQPPTVPPQAYIGQSSVQGQFLGVVPYTVQQPGAPAIHGLTQLIEIMKTQDLSKISAVIEDIKNVLSAHNMHAMAGKANIIDIQKRMACVGILQALKSIKDKNPMA